MNGIGKRVKRYDLSGLKFIFYAQIATILLSILGVWIQKHVVISVIVSVLALVAGVISIVGVFKIGRYGSHFKKCRRIVVAMFLMIFVIIALLIWLISRHDSQLLSITEMFLPLVVGVVAWILGMMFIYHLLYGCGEVADTEGDEKFANRCRRGWTVYLVCYILAAASLIAAWICAALVSDPTKIMVILMILSLVFALVTLVKVMQTLHQTFKKFDGKAIGTAGKPESNPILSGMENTAEIPDLGDEAAGTDDGNTK